MRAAFLLAPLLLTGCISANLTRVNLLEPMPAARWQKLAPGDDLGRCLDQLGAPLRVWEAAGRIYLVYGWLHEIDWGFSVSINITRFVSARFRYSDEGRRMRGLVLTFDGDLRLVALDSGYLADIEPEEPEPAEEELPEGDETATTPPPSE